MPYIDKRDRWMLDIEPEQLEDAGTLNFFITQLCTMYTIEHGLSYMTINEVIGVLECAKQELYRRVAAPYEGFKCRLNGDVYPESLLNIGE